MAHLIAMDPVTVCEHFHHRLKVVCDLINKHRIFGGRVVHHLRRIEYQQRVSVISVEIYAFQGTPHCHMLLWIEGAPTIGIDDMSKVREYIDKHMTCELPSVVTSPLLHKLVVDNQTHVCKPFKCLSSIGRTEGTGQSIMTCKSGFNHHRGRPVSHCVINIVN